MVVSVGTFLSVCVCAVAVALLVSQGPLLPRDGAPDGGAEETAAQLRRALYGLRYDTPAAPPSASSAAGCQLILDESGGRVRGLAGAGFYLSQVGLADGWDRDDDDEGHDDVGDDVDEDDIGEYLERRVRGVHVERVTCDMAAEGGGWTLLAHVRQYADVRPRDEYALTSAHYATFRPRRCIAHLQADGGAGGRGGEILLRDAGRGTALHYSGGESHGLDLLKLALQFDGRWYTVADPALRDGGRDPRPASLLGQAHGTLELVEGRDAARESRAGTVRVLEHTNGRCRYGGEEFPRTCARSVLVRPPEGACRLTGVSDVASALGGQTDGHDVRYNVDIYVR